MKPHQRYYVRITDAFPALGLFPGDRLFLDGDRVKVIRTLAPELTEVAWEHFADLMDTLERTQDTPRLALVQ